MSQTTVCKIKNFTTCFIDFYLVTEMSQMRRATLHIHPFTLSFVLMQRARVCYGGFNIVTTNTD